MHRHEPPITDKPIGIVFEDDNIMAISKPAGVPVHPTGRYNYNSVTEILRHMRPDFNQMRWFRPPSSLAREGWWGAC